MRLHSVVIAAIIGAALAAPITAAAQPTGSPPQVSASDRETARTLMDEGDAAVAKNDYQAALKAYAAAHAIMNVPTTGIEVAKAQLALGQLVEARETALQVSRMPAEPRESPAFEPARKEAAELAAKVAPRIATLQVKVSGLPDGVAPEVSIDGASIVAAAATAPRRVNPGSHKVVVKAPGFLPETADVTAPEGGSVDVPVTLKPAPNQPPPVPVAPPHPTRTPLPVRYAERPLTLPALTLAPALGFRLEHIEAGKLGFPPQNFTNLALGGQFGIIDDFQVDLTLISVDMTEQSNYGLFTVGGLYRFFKSSAFEIGGRFQLGVSGQGLVYLAPEVPIRLHAGRILRVDTGVRFTGVVGRGPARASLSGIEGIPRSNVGSFYPGTAGVPIDISVSVADPFYLGLRSGLGFADLGGFGSVTSAGYTFYGTLGGMMGVTVPSKRGPVMDIQGDFTFPWFLLAGDAKPPLTNVWQVGLTARAYIPLAHD